MMSVKSWMLKTKTPKRVKRVCQDMRIIRMDTTWCASIIAKSDMRTLMSSTKIWWRNSPKPTS